MPFGITGLEIAYDPPAGVNGVNLSTVTLLPPNGTDEGLFDGCTLQAEPAKRLVNIAQADVLIVNSESSFHASFEYCTVDYMRQAGVAVDWLDLSKAEIKGNGHMMFMELNNLVIADCILGWLNGAGTSCTYS